MNYVTLRDKVLSAQGQDPETVNDNVRRSTAENIEKRAREAWLYPRWVELTQWRMCVVQDNRLVPEGFDGQIEGRNFRITDSTFQLYNATSGLWHQIGFRGPDGFSQFTWSDNGIDAERVEIGRVLGVWFGDRRKNKNAPSAEWTADAAGVWINAPNGTKVSMAFYGESPRFTEDLWEEGKAYEKGDVVLHNKDCWVCRVAPAPAKKRRRRKADAEEMPQPVGGDPSMSNPHWVRQFVSSRWVAFIVAACKADYWSEDGQLEKSLNQEGIAEKKILDEEDLNGFETTVHSQGRFAVKRA